MSLTRAKPALVLGLLGDVMLGRLIDQLAPVHVHDPEDGRHASYFSSHFARCGYVYGPHSPWGSLIDLLRDSDLNIANLETAVTTHDIKWPDKVFNYRAHPKSVIPALKAGSIGYVSGANNHTLDFGVIGLKETVEQLDNAGIVVAGIGTSEKRAKGAKFMELEARLGDEPKKLKLAFFSASDHPDDWSSQPGFYFLDPAEPPPSSLAAAIKAAKSQSDLVVFSFHWGPNYAWHPSRAIRSFAHWLVDQGVDLIHGHSSHHVQGIEIYKNKPIFYGIGDAIDDYAVDHEYRNDLGMFCRLHLGIQNDKWTLQQIDLIPTKIFKGIIHKLSPFKLNVPSIDADLRHRPIYEASRCPEDYQWLKSRLTQLCKDLNGRDIVEEIADEELFRIKLG